MEYEKRTDLALDNASVLKNQKSKDWEMHRYYLHGVECIRVDVLTKKGESAYKRKIGTYITLVCGKIEFLDETGLENVAQALCDCIKETSKAQTQDRSFLIVGLGNRLMRSDSLGPSCIEKIGLYESKGKLYLLSPGVASQSGIESKELIKCAISATGATNLILIDSLATSSIDRLCSTIQISSTGLCPGSGTNGSRERISEEELGIPIVSIGVPTVISGTGIILDAISECNIEKVPTCVYNFANNHSSLLVSPSEIDIIISSASEVISKAIVESTKNPLQA